MFSINKWIVEGKVTELVEYKRGYWLTIKGVAKNHNVFCSDSYIIRCWILKKILNDKPIKNTIKLVGRFIFKRGEHYLIAENVV